MCLTTASTATDYHTARKIRGRSNAIVRTLPPLATLNKLRKNANGLEKTELALAGRLTTVPELRQINET